MSEFPAEFRKFRDPPETVPCGSANDIPLGGLRRCQQCSMPYIFPRPSEADVDRKSYESYLEGNRGMWLDVRCGPGYPVQAVGRHGFKPVGLDIREAAVKWARDRSLEALVSRAENLQENLGDRVVQVVDTLFHLRNPGRVQQDLSGLLVASRWSFAGPFDLFLRGELEGAAPVDLDARKPGVPGH